MENLFTILTLLGGASKIFLVDAAKKKKKKQSENKKLRYSFYIISKDKDGEKDP